MMHRRKVWGLVLIAFGTGLLAACLFGLVFAVIVSLAAIGAGFLLLHGSRFC